MTQPFFFLPGSSPPASVRCHCPCPQIGRSGAESAGEDEGRAQARCGQLPASRRVRRSPFTMQVSAEPPPPPLTLVSAPAAAGQFCVCRINNQVNARAHPAAPQPPPPAARPGAAPRGGTRRKAARSRGAPRVAPSPPPRSGPGAAGQVEACPCSRRCRFPCPLPARRSAAPGPARRGAARRHVCAATGRLRLSRACGGAGRRPAPPARPSAARHGGGGGCLYAAASGAAARGWGWGRGRGRVAAGGAEDGHSSCRGGASRGRRAPCPAPPQRPRLLRLSAPGAEQRGAAWPCRRPPLRAARPRRSSCVPVPVDLSARPSVRPSSGSAPARTITQRGAEPGALCED